MIKRQKSAARKRTSRSEQTDEAKADASAQVQARMTAHRNQQREEEKEQRRETEKYRARKRRGIKLKKREINAVRKVRQGKLERYSRKVALALEFKLVASFCSAGV